MAIGNVLLKHEVFSSTLAHDYSRNEIEGGKMSRVSME